VTTQRALLVVAIAAGLVAGLLYYVGAQRVGAVVAAADLAPGRAIAEGDLEVRALPPDALPAAAITDISSAVGQFPRGPVWKGQLLVSTALSPTASALETGISLLTGYRAVAVPVNAAQAVGGAIVAGARVDVIAVPVQGRAPAGRGAEMIAQAALVVDVRGEQGGPFDRHVAARQPATTVRDRLGSVVIAVGPAAEMWIADRIATSTFVVALVHDRP